MVHTTPRHDAALSVTSGIRRDGVATPAAGLAALVIAACCACSGFAGDPCRLRHDLDTLPTKLSNPIQEYASAYGHLPSSLDALVSAGFITHIPVDPLGRPYVLVINSDGSWVVTTATRDRLPSSWECWWAQRPRPLWPFVMAVAAALGSAIAFAILRRRLLLVALVLALALSGYLYHCVGPIQ